MCISEVLNTRALRFDIILLRQLSQATLVLPYLTVFHCQYLLVMFLNYLYIWEGGAGGVFAT